MTRPLTPALALFAVCLAATASSGQSGVDLKPYRLEAKPLTGEVLTKMTEMRDGSRKTRGPDEANNKRVLKEAAQYYVYKVTQDQYYTSSDSGELRSRAGDPDHDLDVALRDLAIQVLVPTMDARLTLDQQDYIHEFGAALDEAVRAVLAKNPPPVIRVNAARMLAVAARSGAKEHAPTIIALLSNKFFKVKDQFVETPPDVLYWTLKAAENLLAAADPRAFGTGTPARHSLEPKELVALVQILEGMVLNGPPVADKAAVITPEQPVKPVLAPVPGAPPAAGAAQQEAAPGGKLEPKGLTPEQVAVVRYFRRQAVRALAKVRFDTLGGENGVPEIHPGWTLAKVAVSDVSINPPPAAAEVGEAVMGLCGIHPSSNLNVDVLLQAIAVGTGSFFGPKAFEPKDKSIGWKLYASRLDAALAGMQKTTQVNPRLKPFQPQINGLAGVITTNVTGPLEKDDAMARPNLDPLVSWVQQNPPKDPNRSLYSDSPKYTLNPRPAGQ